MDKLQKIGKLVIVYSRNLPFRSYEELERFIEWKNSEDGKLVEKLFQEIKPVMDKLA